MATDVERVLGDVTPLLMVSDPPYGVEYDPSWRNQAGTAKTKRTGKVLNDDRADWREAWALFPGDVAYVWHGALHATTVAESLEAAGFAIRCQIIWAKERLVLSRGDYHWMHEPMWYAVKKAGKGHWAGDRKQTTLWQISSRDQDADTVHGTQKPVECMRRPMLNNSSPGQAVYEPFMGSGTTLIAAETTGRVCHGIELNPAYVDVAVERWQRFTGKAAVLEGADLDVRRVEGKARTSMTYCIAPLKRNRGGAGSTLARHHPECADPMQWRSDRISANSRLIGGKAVTSTSTETEQVERLVEKFRSRRGVGKRTVQDVSRPCANRNCCFRASRPGSHCLRQSRIRTGLWCSGVRARAAILGRP